MIITGQIAPKGLETTNPNNGSMLLNVFDSRGKPVQGAVLHIVDTATTTSVVVDDVTNASGTLEVIDIPSGVNAYSVAVTKPGYSSDKNYPVGSSSNPNPLAPYSTVAAGQITQASFSIDLLGSTNMLSVATSCNPIPNFHFSMIGAKLIGTNLPKYSKNLSTDSNGALNLNSMEWDSYTIVPNDSSYDLLGLNPLNPVTLAAGSSTGISLVAVTKSPKSLLITVEDNGSHQVVGGATVELDGPSSYTKTLLDMTGSTNCFPPGEFLFQSLNAGTYTVHVSKSGYTSTSASITVSNDWMESVVLLPKDH